MTLMEIEYTKDEFVYLGALIDKNLELPEPHYEILVPEILEEFPDQKDFIYDLVGAYYCSLSHSECEERGMGTLAFEKELCDMFSYEKSHYPWEKLIAQWRILIEK